MQDKIYSLDADDFGFLLPGFDDILRLKQHYDDFKITLFTIPLPNQFFYSNNAKHFKGDKYKEWAKIMNGYDWLQIGLHGFFHTLGEFDCNYYKAIDMITAAENLFKSIDLKYEKIFRAPYWQYSYEALNALKDKGYTVCINPEYPVAAPEGLKVYKHNWSFEKKIPKEKWIKGHGHIFETGGSTNAIGACLGNITKQIPQDAKFKFIYEK